MENNDEFETFLKNVDEINELLKDLNSSDDEIRKRAMEDADSYAAALDGPCRTKFNKTKINTIRPHQPYVNPQNESPESFMKSLEKNAEDRRRKRIVKEKKAIALKDKGNEAYAREDYENAVKYYSDGLAELRDMQQLYTNRAQAYHKLGRYKEAISDCEWALKCNERCTKAYLHMGKAYLELKHYNESRRCFEKMLEIEPGRETFVKEYLTRVDLEQEKETQERNAKQEFDTERTKATALPHLLVTLSRPGQTSLFCCGLLQILLKAVADCTGQTLFRLHNGFSIISSNDTVRSCLLQKTKDVDSQELCASVLKLWRVICNGNAENQKMLLMCPLARQAVASLVASEQVAVRRECLALLSLCSQVPHGRRFAVEGLNVQVLARNLMVCISEPAPQQESTAVFVLENFAAENKFCIQLREVLRESVIQPFTSILTHFTNHRQVLPLLISAIGRLAQDDIIRHKLAHDSECWTAIVNAMRQGSTCKFREILYPLLGLIINLSTVTSPVIQEHAVSLCDCCQGLLRDTDGGVVTRATGVLSTVLPQSSEAVQHVIQQDVVRTMRRLLKGQGQTATKYAIKTLTVCTAASRLAREELLTSDKKLSVLRRLLAPGCDEVVSGNAALCLAHCIELDGVARRLLGTDIVPLLLCHAARDAKKTAVQRNAAIALGKLCQSEPRHMDKLRELHGFEVLHSCMKLIT